MRRATGYIFTIRNDAPRPSPRPQVIRLWDLRSGGVVARLTGHSDNIRALLLSADKELVGDGMA